MVIPVQIKLFQLMTVQNIVAAATIHETSKYLPDP